MTTRYFVKLEHESIEASIGSYFDIDSMHGTVEDAQKHIDKWIKDDDSYRKAKIYKITLEEV
jgi:hypothetical protein